ncbi:signal peptidase I [Campylobacter canadensis]|uniref:Signal peptidase I n=1 Tax=Campylobacter canadensis TaxID=449520 RepID=A0ABS7WR83_9BACT|nr:signal peptidase I [Campylobacter canadensis]MBZ7987273.1 signal peptidase I [Campylobacter canadensis]MBZ7994351.1 signal peptidase I [Campylobacter canadensis]MBZ7996048.1 signal peptidase I [Campylobacter canadensis]MBZ7998298.1 signal peptidase I [Campylobacter canadensis]MBZ7999684.1 signal peptidase I [Campylobacter canadensis]
MTKFQKFIKFYNSWTGTIIFVLLFMAFIAQAFTIPSGSMMRTLLIGDHLFVKKFSYGIPIPHIPFLEIPLLPDFNKNGHLISSDGPKRGDIVVFRFPYNNKIHFVKRCVALGDDEIIFNDKTLYVRMKEGDEYMKNNYAKEDLVMLNNRLFVKEPYKFPGISYDQKNRQLNNGEIDFDKELFMAVNSSKSPMVLLPKISGIDNNLPIYYYKVPSEKYFMMGDNRDHSNDSRFWGSVDYKYIEGKPWFVYLSWDDDYNFRWERMFKSVQTLQDNEYYTNLNDHILHTID